MTFRLVVLLAVAATAASAQRVSFPNFTGPGAAGVRNQIVGAVCDTADCVAATRTTTGGKPDWKKARKESVLFFVTANVVKKGKALWLDVQVLNKAGPAKARKTFALDKNGTLPAKGLQQVMDLLTGAFGGSTRSAAEPPPATTPDAVKTQPKETSKPADALPTSPPKRDPEQPAPQGAEPDTRGTAPKASKTRPKFLMIDVGADLFTRRLEYSQVATSNLRRYDLGLTGMAALGVSFFPLALMRDDLLAGLGVEFAIGFAPWIQSRLTSTTTAFPTSAMRIDGGIRWELRPIKTFALAISPYVGVRSQSFTVSPVMGQRIDGLPNIAHVGLRAGLGLDIPLIENRLNVFGRFGIIPVFGSGEISSPAFFPNGSAFGLEANAGVGVTVLPFMQIRASFELARYGLTFVTQPTDTYVAAGAAETYLGGNASLRFMF
jgi:hypothetical protein